MKKFLLAVFLLFLMKPVIMEEASEDSSAVADDSVSVKSDGIFNN